MVNGPGVVSGSGSGSGSGREDGRTGGREDGWWVGDGWRVAGGEGRRTNDVCPVERICLSTVYCLLSCLLCIAYLRICVFAYCVPANGNGNDNPWW